MNPRERFIKTLKFAHPDRIYYSFGPPRKSTPEAWKLQGLPDMPETDDYDCPDEFYEFVGMDPNPWQLSQEQSFPVDLGIYPPFGIEIIKEDESGLTWRDEKGIVMHDAGRKLGTPGFRTRSYLSHPVTGFGDWPEMQKRFDPHSPGRFPDNWDQVVRSFKARETPLVVIVYGLFSLGRDWVGSEPVSVFATQEIGQGGVDEKHFEQGCTVFGERGNIYIPQAFSQVEILRFGRMVEATLFITDHRIGSRQTETVRIEAVHQWRLEQEFFADRVLTGRTIELPGENGVANMRAIDAVVQSARTGTHVEL